VIDTEIDIFKNNQFNPVGPSPAPSESRPDGGKWICLAIKSRSLLNNNKISVAVWPLVEGARLLNVYVDYLVSGVIAQSVSDYCAGGFLCPTMTGYLGGSAQTK